MSRTAPGGLVTHLADASSPVGFDAAFTPAFTSPINLDDESTALGDWDGDGHIDLVGRVNRSGHRLGYAPGTGDGDFGDVIVPTIRVDDSATCGHGTPPRGLRLSEDRKSTRLNSSH